mmetsp:Transcript_36147/g.108174  ORF Transcript_36147/g.108174 Transcript_36147/m.108174 type:complete len:241 (+) Transcript_36147:38-760(+)
MVSTYPSRNPKETNKTHSTSVQLQFFEIEMSTSFIVASRKRTEPRLSDKHPKISLTWQGIVGNKLHPKLPLVEPPPREILRTLRSPLNHLKGGIDLPPRFLVHDNDLPELPVFGALILEVQAYILLPPLFRLLVLVEHVVHKYGGRGGVSAADLLGVWSGCSGQSCRFRCCGWGRGRSSQASHRDRRSAGGRGGDAHGCVQGRLRDVGNLRNARRGRSCRARLRCVSSSSHWCCHAGRRR